ncbi:MAG: enhanced serine sensitivity protein SseB C-terminal domain-containing protein [Peptococcia bacterium]
MIIDPQREITNQGLVLTMEKYLTEKTNVNEVLLVDQIMQAEFLTPIILEGEIENGVLKPGSTLDFITIINEQNESYLMAFTDWAELRKWSDQQKQTMIVTYDDLKGMVSRDDSVSGFAINPYGHNFLITPQIMDYFAKINSALLARKKEQRVSLKEPEYCPQEMLTALKQYFKTEKGVKSAYLFSAKRDGQTKPYYLFIVDYEGETGLLFPQVQAITRSFLPPEELIEILPLNSSFGLEAIKTASPFYLRMGD